MKRVLCGLLTFAAIAFAFPHPAHAEFDASKIKSASAVLIESKSKRIFFEKEGSMRCAPASTTKIMTAIIALETEELDTVMKAGSEINKFTKASSLMGLKEGETATLRDLLYGMMLVSGNDAAATVGKTLGGGSIESFAKIMNEKAADLGMNNSHFMNPHGVQDEEHYSTAFDMAKLAAYAMENETFRKIVGTKEYTAKSPSKHKEPMLLKNTNKLIYFDTEKDDQDFRYRYATGIKTGLTTAAGGCLVASAEKDGVELIVALMGDKTSKYNGRWEEARALFEYGFNNFATITLNQLSVSTKFTAPVSGAAPDESGNAVASVGVSVTLGDQAISGMRDEIDALRKDATPIKAELHLDKDLVAPVAKGQAVGTVSFRLGDEIIAILEAQADADVLAAATPPMPPMPTVIGPTTRPSSDNNPILYVILVLLALLLVFLVLRIIRLRNLKRSRAKRLATRRQTGSATAGRKRSVGNRYYMYSKSRN